jgi:DNA-binding NarL/FixJ family response regulator
MSEPTRIAIVEDKEAFRRDLVAFLDEGTRFAVLGDFGNAEDAVKALPRLAPEVVLMDISLPKASGIECTSRLKELMPGTQFLMLTVYEDTDTIFRALQAGATGYLLKRAAPARIVEAILEIKRGGAPMTSHIARKVVESFKAPAGTTHDSPGLTPRESEVLICWPRDASTRRSRPDSTSATPPCARTSRGSTRSSTYVRGPKPWRRWPVGRATD